MSAAHPPPAANHALGSLWRRMLRVPLFYKILIANAGIALVATVGTTLFTRAILRAGADFPTAWVIVIAVASVLATVLVNAIIVRVALSPLKLLERTARAVQTGDMDARVPYSPLRDRELERLTGIFNGMLDTLESYQHHLTALTARALNAEEEERKRIARELHDDTAQSLAALLIRLRLLRTIEDQQGRAAMIDDFREQVGDALERVRRFARGLRPAALDELGLVPAIESHVRSLSESVGIPIRIEADHVDAMLSQEAELALYRIAQESISNAVRHAQPTRVVVRIRRESRAVVLSVSDDGRGFEIEEVNTSQEGGLGIFGMKERASYVGGQVTIRSVRSEGTDVRAVIPVASIPEVIQAVGVRSSQGPSIE
jgi:two-component system sensor histidine kinase UhpB